MKKLLLILLLALAPSLAFASSGTFVADGTATVTEGGYQSTSKLNTLYLRGTFGSGTVTVEASPDGTNFVAIPSYSWTSAAVVNIEFRWVALRIKLTGSTGPSLTWVVL